MGLILAKPPGLLLYVVVNTGLICQFCEGVLLSVVHTDARFLAPILTPAITAKGCGFYLGLSSKRNPVTD